MLTKNQGTALPLFYTRSLRLLSKTEGSAYVLRDHCLVVPEVYIGNRYSSNHVPNVLRLYIMGSSHRLHYRTKGATMEKLGVPFSQGCCATHGTVVLNKVGMCPTCTTEYARNTAKQVSVTKLAGQAWAIQKESARMGKEAAWIAAAGHLATPAQGNRAFCGTHGWVSPNKHGCCPKCYCEAAKGNRPQTKCHTNEEPVVLVHQTEQLSLQF